MKWDSLPRLVQIKSDRKSAWENFRPDDRRELMDIALQAGGEAWLIWWPPRGQMRWLSHDEWPAIKPSVRRAVDAVDAADA